MHSLHHSRGEAFDGINMYTFLLFTSANALPLRWSVKPDFVRFFKKLILFELIS